MELEKFKEDNPDWPDQGEIVFEDVTLKYRPNTDIMLTGAGKSAVCLSLNRIVDIVSG
eukprot:CAMPEP_0176399352 /NCGR_PEP_ID=MMETSP0126-20121128/46697_1 /TAXON_ID=141414 ORGANISM="Strombidinopsis acuminatum, Strain SPMC142" /NCGR_SAMPLE_ID=MMETSP0126 /ASSEMBLY_ACC=CAM_ASM_000229 /LENGTH=57 /DNA_ID=CAMNT_0017774893 /DNA_START=27 /DNA_END=200 /DNA_ORIENTATION=+